MKKIVLIDGHPDGESFCSAMAKEYCRGVQDCSNGCCSVDMIAVRDLRFDPILHFGYRQKQEIEEDLVRVQKLITDCSHLVVIVPVWWGNFPALFKGFLDRCFVSGFSHRFDPIKKRPVKLLKGKTATIIYTQGSPWWYSRFFLADSFWKIAKRGVFSFAGFKPVKRKYYSTVKSGTDEERKRILGEVYQLGQRAF